ncbi:hypothetical protein Patl1_18642 [Pistacia atlantica]|uniref:Uncharacterized protein n=1 Tax=Pistacia atlantica TaxID=434234 RepID=A0ACC1C0F3_9ROSI|nr:hypothetical protein Patl1_18642 [Pistacia atlantica]
MKARNWVLLMLCVTVISPIVLYTDRFSASFKASSSRNQFLEDLSAFIVGGDASHLNPLPEEAIVLPPFVALAIRPRPGV